MRTPLKESILFRLLNLLKNQGFFISLATLLGLGAVFSSIGLLSFGAWVISMAALHPSIAELQLAIVGIRFFGIARGLFRYLERLVSHRVSLSLLAEFRTWFFEKIERLAPAKLNSFESGDILARINTDIESLQDFYIRVISPPIIFVFTSLIVSAITFSMNKSIGVVLILGYAIAGVLLPLYLRKQYQPITNTTVKTRSEINTTIVDIVQGNADILSFNAQTTFRLRLEDLINKNEVSRIKMGHYDGLDSGINMLLMNFIMLIALIIAIPRIDSVNLASLALGIIASFESIIPLPRVMKELDSGLLAGERLFSIVDTEPEIYDNGELSTLPQNPSIEILNLSFRYPGRKSQALNDISLEIGPGEKVALVGPSGAGKSTISHLLLRFWEFNTGTIKLGGRDIKSYRLEAVRNSISTVSQNGYLFNTTIKENLLLSNPAASNDAIRRACDLAGLTKYIESVPMGIETLIGEGGVNLSGGERQRIAIAQAWLKNCPIFILDEPTAHLDAVNEMNIMNSMNSLINSKTTILITHRLISLENFDKIYVLVGGEIVESGQQKELMKKQGVYYRLRMLQQR